MGLLVALSAVQMPPKGDSCRSLNIPNGQRCVVCRNPNNASTRRLHGRVCLVAKARKEHGGGGGGGEGGAVSVASLDVL